MFEKITRIRAKYLRIKSYKIVFGSYRFFIDRRIKEENTKNF
jgi:hypothetical protein